MTSRALQTSRCPHCKATTLNALDDDHFAHDTHIDPTPISATAELLAIAAGRTTYDLLRRDGNTHLAIREAPHISHQRRYPVHATHSCDAPPLPAAPAGHDPAQLPDDPPF